MFVSELNVDLIVYGVRKMKQLRNLYFIITNE